MHRAGLICRPRRDGGTCEHGRPLGCPTVHAPADPLVGQPVCPDCYDYTGHVLWYAHASKLCDRFVIDVRRRLASSADVVQSRFARHARLSFARIAEYQKRAAVHVHAVVRLDGPDGPTDEPPPWGTPDRLTRAVNASAQRVTVRTPYSPAVGEVELSWGTQADVRVLHADGDGPDDDAVAAYVAKYVTKGTDETGAGTDRKVTTRDDINTAPVSRHVRTLMHTCWRLGDLPEYAPLRLRTWTHTLGYRGHILTKSRVYSTTYAALRAERAHHLGHTDIPDAITDAYWRYVGSGHTPGAALIAAGVAADLAECRRLSAEASQQGGGVDNSSAQA
ncbi:replication initiator [Streptomyces tendae]|uniref:replication initiator n=1 Tax=Streptomyces tendae TaxID=1932 RepID=UPI0033B36EE1